MSILGRWKMPALGKTSKLLVSAASIFALSNAAQAALFVTYGASGTNTTSLAATSQAIDLGGLFSDVSVVATLGLTLTSGNGTTLSTANEGLQTLQGCSKAAALCSGSDWFDIVGQESSLGGASFSQTTTPTQVQGFSTGSIVITGVSVESLRLSFAADIVPAASVGATGSLSANVAAVPEPETWVMLLAGILSIGWIAKRRIK